MVVYVIVALVLVWPLLGRLRKDWTRSRDEVLADLGHAEDPARDSIDQKENSR